MSSLAKKTENPAPKSKKSPRKYSHVVDKEIAILRSIQGKPVSEIAKEFNVTPSAITQLLKPYRDYINGYAAYSKDKANYMEFKQFMVMHNLNEEKIKKMGAAQSITGIAILEDKIQSIRGLAPHSNTDNNRIDQDTRQQITVQVERVIINQLFNDNNKLEDSTSDKVFYVNNDKKQALIENHTSIQSNSASTEDHTSDHSND